MDEQHVETSQHAEKRVRLATVLVAAAAFFALVVLAGSATPACVGCHAEAAKAMRPTSHSKVGCYRCHLDRGLVSWPEHKARELFVMYPSQVLRGGRLQRASRETSRLACLRCHEKVLEGTLTARGLRIDHAACAPGPSCDPCHSTTAHGAAVRFVREPVMSDCIACHNRREAPVGCDACHEGRLERDRIVRGPWQITHGPQWESLHGMGDLDTCKTCHPAGYCERCHEVQVPHGTEFGAQHGKLAIAKRAACEACHKQRSFCDGCHGAEMPHPKGFLQRHSSIASSSKDPRCVGCHAQDDCLNCHSYHIHPGGPGMPRTGG